MDAKQFHRGIAVVTGGGSGIGEAICRSLDQDGFSVVIADLDLQAAERVATSLTRASALQIDVSVEESVDRAAALIPEVTVLVNNAGIGLVGSVEETEPADFERIMRVNVNSVFYMTRSLLPKLRRSRGRIINIASVAGQVGVKRRFAYCASKGAVIAMTRQLAVDYPRELRANCICPGTIDSPFVAGYIAKYHTGEEDTIRAELNARQPVGRLGHPDEVARLVSYLSSADSDFMQGAVIALDGGWTAV